MDDTIQNVAHVVPVGAADRLRELGAEVVVEFPDTVSHGPSHRDPKRHREMRLEYWRGLYERLLPEDTDALDDAVGELHDGYLSTEQIGSVMDHHADERRLVLWSTPTLEDRLFLWLCFEAARAADISASRLATAEPRVPVTPDEEDYFALRDLDIEEIAEGFDAIVYPKEIYAQAGAQLWQTFSSSSPRKFAISVPHTEKFFPNITNIAERYGWMFPTADGDQADTLFPSQFDRELLGSIPSEDWVQPLEILGGELVEDFHFVDDLAVAARLVDWARHADDDPFVESRVDDPEAGPFGRLAFRSTERAARVCEEGFADGADAPVMHLGDCRIYAGDQPWTKIVEDEYWWFERFAPDDESD